MKQFTYIGGVVVFELLSHRLQLIHSPVGKRHHSTKKALLGFEPWLYYLLDRHFNQLSHSTKWYDLRKMVIWENAGVY